MAIDEIDLIHVHPWLDDLKSYIDMLESRILIPRWLGPCSICDAAIKAKRAYKKLKGGY